MRAALLRLFESFTLIDVGALLKESTGETLGEEASKRAAREIAGEVGLAVGRCMIDPVPWPDFLLGFVDGDPDHWFPVPDDAERPSRRTSGWSAPASERPPSGPSCDACRSKPTSQQGRKKPRATATR